MNTHSDIIKAIGIRRLADGLGLPYVNVNMWRQRNKIPPESWPKVVDIATESGLELTLEDYFFFGPDAPSQ